MNEPIHSYLHTYYEDVEELYRNNIYRLGICLRRPSPAVGSIRFFHNHYHLELRSRGYGTPPTCV
jgi:hypothetical protein